MLHKRQGLEEVDWHATRAGRRVVARACFTDPTKVQVMPRAGRTTPTAATAVSTLLDGEQNVGREIY
jgi:hypothetical protein